MATYPQKTENLWVESLADVLSNWRIISAFELRDTTAAIFKVTSIAVTPSLVDLPRQGERA